MLVMLTSPVMLFNSFCLMLNAVLSSLITCLTAHVSWAREQPALAHSPDLLQRHSRVQLCMNQLFTHTHKHVTGESR